MSDMKEEGEVIGFPKSMRSSKDKPQNLPGEVVQFSPYLMRKQVKQSEKELGSTNTTPATTQEKRIPDLASVEREAIAAETDKLKGLFRNPAFKSELLQALLKHKDIELLTHGAIPSAITEQYPKVREMAGLLQVMIKKSSINIVGDMLDDWLEMNFPDTPTRSKPLVMYDEKGKRLFLSR